MAFIRKIGSRLVFLKALVELFFIKTAMQHLDDQQLKTLLKPRWGPAAQKFEEDERIMAQIRAQREQKEALALEASEKLARLKNLGFKLAQMPLNGEVEIVNGWVEKVSGLGEFHLGPGILKVTFAFAAELAPHPLYPEFKVLPVSWQFSDANGQTWEIEMKYTGKNFAGFIDDDVYEALPDHIKLQYAWWSDAPEAIQKAFSETGLAKNVTGGFEDFDHKDAPVQIGGTTVRIDMKHSTVSSDLGWIPGANSIVIRISDWRTSFDHGFDEIPPFYFTVPLGSIFPLTSIFRPLNEAYEDGLLVYKRLPETGTPEPNLKFVPETD